LHIECDTLLVDFIQTQTAEFCGHGHEESRLASLPCLADAWPQGDLWVRARTVRSTFSNYTPMASRRHLCGLCASPFAPAH
jgi:hypothetical protein